MSSSDLRSVNPLLTINERNDVHRSIAKAKAEQNDVRQSIATAETELQRLLDHQEKVMNNLSQLKKTLVIHRILPGEIIGYIFSILRAGNVSIPHKRHMTPPQIIVSHVCLKWREIALTTPALWSNVEIVQPGSNHWVHVALELLFDRADRRGVNLALNMEEISSKVMGKLLYNIVLPLHVKKLHLTLPLSTLGSLSKESDSIITNIDEIALSITPDSSLVPIQSTSGHGGIFGTSSSQAPIAPNSAQVSVARRLAPFLNKIRSLMILRRGATSRIYGGC